MSINSPYYTILLKVFPRLGHIFIFQLSCKNWSNLNWLICSRASCDSIHHGCLTRYWSVAPFWINQWVCFLNLFISFFFNSTLKLSPLFSTWHSFSRVILAIDTLSIWNPSEAAIFSYELKIGVMLSYTYNSKRFYNPNSWLKPFSNIANFGCSL